MWMGNGVRVWPVSRCSAMAKELLAAGGAGAQGAGHRLHGGEAGEAAGDEGQEHQAKENATQELRVSLNGRTSHLKPPLECWRRP